ncbi:MAG: indolepyruvate oxidoreductase subunit beta [Candidatus Methanomethylophilaceae archaeon]|jgi:indolepyruvate ferredoxin oxidoreductase beta subunit
MRYTIQIVGVGGQGVLLASMVLGNAAMREGHQVCMSEVHGMAQRGGSVLSTLRMGDDVISPLEAMGEADLIMGFEPVETARSLPLGNSKTTIVMNVNPMIPTMVSMGLDTYPPVESIVASIQGKTERLFYLDATEIALEAGMAVAANAVMIGAVAGVKGFPLSVDILEETLMDLVPTKFREVNRNAFRMGYELVRKD